MRGLLPGVGSPHPLGPTLPGVYAGDGRAEEPIGVADTVGLAFSPLPLGTYTTTITHKVLSELSDDLLAGAQASLPGIWVLALREDEDRRPETMAIALFRDGQPQTTGAGTRSHDVLTLTTASCGAATGSYRWRFDGDSLELVSLEDTCGVRRAVLTARPWQRRNLAMRLMSAFDEALAPIFCTLDNLDAYLDPRITPADFVDWLSGWVGLTPTQAWDLRRRRDRIARAVPLARSWGTADAIKELVAVFAGIEPGDVDVVENGGVGVSATAGGEIPGSPEPRLTVRVKVPDPAGIDLPALRRVVKAAKPAGMLDEVEVVKQ